jgi:hypothetical protein
VAGFEGDNLCVEVARALPSALAAAVGADGL